MFRALHPERRRISPHRRSAAAALLALLALSVACGQRSRSPCPGCNIVLITIDALRADHLGLYGHVRDTSPRIDSLGRESVVFAQAVIAWPKTTPGLGSLLTGRYADSLRMMYFTLDPMREDSTLLSEILQQHGYATAAFTTNGNLGSNRGWAQGFDEYGELWKRDGRPHQVAARGRDFVSRKKGGKFFLWLHYIDPHSPYAATYAAGEPKFQGRYVGDEHADRLLYDPNHARRIPIQTDPPFTWRNWGIGGIPGNVVREGRDDVAFYIAEYDAEIRYTDHYVGEVLDQLDREGLVDRTIVVVTADHGEALGDHNWYFDHGRFAYEDSSRIPLVIRVPGLRPRRVAAPVSSVDLAPTLLELVGIEPPADIEGGSLVSVLRGERERLAEYVFHEAGYNREPETSVRDGRWKLIYVPSPEARSVMRGGPFELYDLEADPLETRDRAGEEPEVLDRLRGALFAWLEERKPPLMGYEMINGQSEMYLTDYDFPGVAVEGNRFYAKVAADMRRLDYCFALPVPDPGARITIDLVEANAIERPFAKSAAKWDDRELGRSCLGDAWGCLEVNGQRIETLPHTVQLAHLAAVAESRRVVLHGLGNDKTFCFRPAEFSKRDEASPLGYVVEIRGFVERRGHGFPADLDEATRENLRTLGYLE